MVLPDAGDGVLIELGINTDDRDFLHQGLGHQQTVKRVFMVARKGNQCRCVLWLDVEDGKAVIDNGVLDELVISLGKNVLAKAHLDGELPIARGTYLFVIARILNGCLCGAAQPGISLVEPHEAVGVEQNPHGM